MKTTLNIDDDVLYAAKEAAKREGSTIGKVISDWARRGLRACNEKPRETFRLRNGIPVIPSRGGPKITLEHIQAIMDEEGI